jgi:rhodanese-related sulfurtransferase
MKHSPGFLKLVEAARAAGVEETTVSEVMARLALGEHFELVDCREESEFAAGHIKSAKHIGKGVIERDIEAKIPDKDADVVIYCGGGYRSLLAGEAIKKMGYTRVKSMAGGWREWKEAKGPTE